VVLKALFPHLSSYRFCGIAIGNDQLTFMLQPRIGWSRCPACNKRSHRVHSRYVRTLSELPVCGLRLSLILYVRRFRCARSRCARAIFCERLTGLALPYARSSNNYRKSVQIIGLSTGGNEGARVAHSLRMKTSSSTILRRVHEATACEAGSVRVLGVDDWAFRKGTTYGTILCDLERGCVVDLLSERSAEVLSHWLSKHPEVEIISRDRGGIYAQGASAGAPQAKQVADRFHLLQNLTEVMRRVLDRQHSALNEASKDERNPSPEPAVAAEPIEQRRQEAVPTPTPSQQRRQALYERIKELANAGLSIRAISRDLTVHRATVRRFLQADAAPPISAHRPPISATVLSGYSDTIDALLAEGETNMMSIYKEIKKAGFPGSARPVYRYIRKYHPDVKMRKHRSSEQQAARVAAQRKPLTPRSATWILLKDEKDVTEREGRLRRRLEELSPEIRKSAELAWRFAGIVRSRKPDEFDTWLAAAEASGVPEFNNFAKGLRRDYDAVRAGLTLKWSNGPVEGHINRLKLVKRCMYGRGSLELLKRRYIRPT
jgi:transposase